MAEVRVVEGHGVSADEARTRIGPFEEMMKKYGVKAKWKDHHAALKGPGVSGSIDVTASEVTVVVKLGMLARAAGVDPKRLEASIRKRLEAAFQEI